MKMKRPHVVPLSAQSLSALRQLEELTGTYQLIFAGRNDVNKAMSEASVNMVIKRVGYDKSDWAWFSAHNEHHFA